jgi:hypothetical protein
MTHEINIGGIYVSPFVVVLVLTLLIFYPCAHSSTISSSRNTSGTAPSPTPAFSS